MSCLSLFVTATIHARLIRPINQIHVHIIFDIRLTGIHRNRKSYEINYHNFLHRNGINPNGHKGRHATSSGSFGWLSPQDWKRHRHTQQRVLIPKGSICFCPFILLFRNPDILPDPTYSIRGVGRTQLETTCPVAVGCAQSLL